MLNNEYAAFQQAFNRLDGINKDVITLARLGSHLAAKGAQSAWLDEAVRLAVKPAETRELAEFKLKLILGNLYGWAIKASRDNCMTTACGLIFGALGMEAHEWDIEFPNSLEACCTMAPSFLPEESPRSGSLAAYRKRAKTRELSVALKRCKDSVRAVARLRTTKGASALPEAIDRAWDALLDVLAIPARSVAELELKQRAYIDHCELPANQWLFMTGASVAFKTEYNLLDLHPLEVNRLKGMFPHVWTANTRPHGV